MSELGDGATDDRNAPAQIGTSTGRSHVSADAEATVATRIDAQEAQSCPAGRVCPVLTVLEGAAMPSIAAPVAPGALLGSVTPDPAPPSTFPAAPTTTAPAPAAAPSAVTAAPRSHG
jgi:hypothetical protein